MLGHQGSSNMFLIAVIFLVAVDIGNGEKIRLVPMADKHFNLKKYQGTWYSQVFVQPCTFNGAADHSNHRHDCYLKEGYLACQNTYRGPDGDCVIRMPARLKLTGNPGIFTVSDNLGSVMNGPVVVTNFFPKTLMCEWGCTRKIGDDGRCEDAWASCKTRRRIPSPKTWKQILRILYEQFGIPASAVIRRNQNNPCTSDAVSHNNPGDHLGTPGRTVRLSDSQIVIRPLPARDDMTDFTGSRRQSASTKWWQNEASGSSWSSPGLGNVVSNGGPLQGSDFRLDSVEINGQGTANVVDRIAASANQDFRVNGGPLGESSAGNAQFQNQELKWKRQANFPEIL